MSHKVARFFLTEEYHRYVPHNCGILDFIKHPYFEARFHEDNDKNRNQGGL